ncbi:MAG: radical SAM protein [Chlorobium sp.]|nr:radical SAM protein [Chlorobium sp.]
MYVSALLKQVYDDVKVLNYNLFDYDLSEELKGATDIFFTGFEEFEKPIKEAATIAKTAGVKTHLGGAIATYIPSIMNGYIDYIYTGEFCELMPIDKNPWPDYEGFGINEYHRRHNTRYMGVLTSRGCPHKCTFCNSICKYRCRSISAVEQEVDYYLSKYKTEMIVFNDNTLNASKGRFRRICEMMNGKGVAWSAALRLDNIDESLVKRAKDSGLVYAVVGVESFQQEKLDKMNKQITVKTMENSLELLEKYQIKYHGNIIMGFDGETEQQIADEFEDLKKRPWNVFPVYLQKFIGVKASPSGNYELSNQFKEHIYSKDMYCYPGVL